MIGYKKQDIHRMAEEVLLNIETLYRQPCINYRGKTTDTKETYTEVLAEAVLHKLDLFGNITAVSRKRSYRVAGHKGITDNDQSNRVEEQVARNMFGKSFSHIGRVLDYQVPLKDARDNKAGKIDLLSFKDDTLIILELKKENSQETLLRCTLEVATYWHKVDKDKLLKDFDEFNAKRVQPAILVYKDGAQHNEYKDASTNIRKLMNQLQVGMYVINGYYDLQVFGIGLP